jgi:histidinol-phosphate phosphatase family protein
MNKAIFLDRDGTINNDDTGYTYKLEDFKLLPGVIEALNLLKNDFKFFIITNQSGIGRGYYTLDDANKFNQKMLKEFEKENIKVEKIYICPHTPEEKCSCRKPSVKFIKEAEKEFGIDLKKSWIIGDHPWDVGMKEKSGCRAIYVLTGHGEKHKDDLEKNNIKPDFIAKNLLEASEFILKN